MGSPPTSFNAERRQRERDAATRNVATKRGGHVLLRQLTEDFFMSETRQTLAIESLVRRRCMELGLSQPELTRRCGYKNISKGLRRLD